MKARRTAQIATTLFILCFGFTLYEFIWGQYGFYWLVGLLLAAQIVVLLAIYYMVSVFLVTYSQATEALLTARAADIQNKAALSKFANNVFGSN